ncbi:MAG: hypothetical protein LBD16_09170 [Oscillospiraceae bacterium]|nr:hypothetical protein [Oscillospiraceae bacterium]
MAGTTIGISAAGGTPNNGASSSAGITGGSGTPTGAAERTAWRITCVPFCRGAVCGCGFTVCTALRRVGGGGISTLNSLGGGAGGGGACSIGRAGCGGVCGTAGAAGTTGTPSPRITSITPGNARVFPSILM